MRVASSAVCVFLAAAATAWSPAGPPAAGLALHRAAVRPSRAVVARRVTPQPVAMLGAGAGRRQGAALLATASAAPAPALMRSASLALKLLVSSLCSVLCFAARALAAERLKTVSATTAPFVLSGDVLKWGGLAAVCGTAYLFRKEETPILTETVVEHPEAQAAAAEDGEEAPAAEFDMMADMKKRMQELAEEKARAEEEKPADDSTEEWGTGNTAVLEPPKPAEPPSGLLEDGPAVDFPVGFPLRDMDEPAPEPEPAYEPELASQSDIEMLERMFGTRGEDA